MKFLREAEKTLNPKLFDTNGKLKPEVLNAFRRIVNTFAHDLEGNDIPLDILDTWLVGSNAAFNYSDSSDIDLHIQVNLKEESKEPELLNTLYNYAKTSFNKEHDISVKGLPVELYVEDVKTSSITNGIYSLNNNDWIKFPERLNQVAGNDISASPLFQEWENRYINLKDEEIENFINALYLMRKTSLNTDGEFSDGNLVFKEFRKRGYLDNLKERKKKYISRELTLERYGR